MANSTKRAHPLHQTHTRVQHMTHKRLNTQYRHLILFLIHTRMYRTRHPQYTIEHLLLSPIHTYVPHITPSTQKIHAHTSFSFFSRASARAFASPPSFFPRPPANGKQDLISVLVMETKLFVIYHRIGSCMVNDRSYSSYISVLVRILVNEKSYFLYISVLVRISMYRRSYSSYIRVLARLFVNNWTYPSYISVLVRVLVNNRSYSSYDIYIHR